MNYSLPLICAFLLVPVAQSFAQPDAEAKSHPKPKRLYVVRPMKTTEALDHEALQNQSSSGATIPLWTYNVFSPLDGQSYRGTMVGRNPFFHGHRITYIPTYVIPVVLTFADSNTTFDPTTTGSCLGETVLNATMNSPIFQNAGYNMNGANIGTTQYVDAFQRANFWQQVAGTPYFTYLSGSASGPVRPNVLPPVRLTVPVSEGFTDFSGFCPLGKMANEWWDNFLQTTLMPSLVSKGVTPKSFPIFLFDSVVQYFNNDPDHTCCALGYHSAFASGGNLQTYSISSWDNSGNFGGDISVTSHEVAEWMDDPAVNNLTPAWGHVGQAACQGNLEVGDPLTGTDWGTVTLNGTTYTVQELAFFSWFFRQPASSGAGGYYSNNRTFTAGQPMLCQ